MSRKSGRAGSWCHDAGACIGIGALGREQLGGGRYHVVGGESGARIGAKGP